DVWTGKESGDQGRSIGRSKTCHRVPASTRRAKIVAWADGNVLKGWRRGRTGRSLIEVRIEIAESCPILAGRTAGGAIACAVDQRKQCSPRGSPHACATESPPFAGNVDGDARACVRRDVRHHPGIRTGRHAGRRLPAWPGKMLACATTT